MAKRVTMPCRCTAASIAASETRPSRCDPGAIGEERWSQARRQGEPAKSPFAIRRRTAEQHDPFRLCGSKVRSLRPPSFVRHKSFDLGAKSATSWPRCFCRKERPALACSQMRSRTRLSTRPIRCSQRRFTGDQRRLAECLPDRSARGSAQIATQVGREQLRPEKAVLRAL